MTRKKALAEDPLSVGHHNSDTLWGYDVLADGSIRLCEATASPMLEAMGRENGLYDMQRGIASFVAEELAKTFKEKARFWDKVFAGLGVDRGSGERWSFDPYTRTISLHPEKPDEATP